MVRFNKRLASYKVPIVPIKGGIIRMLARCLGGMLRGDCLLAADGHLTYDEGTGIRLLNDY